MKSFSIVSLHLNENEEYRELDFSEGIIINKEAEENSWLIEISLQKSREERLKKYLNKAVDILVKITRPTNAPAHFLGELVDINEIEDTISVIFKGEIQATNANYPVELLEELLEKGFTGDELMEKFKQNMGNKKES